MENKQQQNMQDQQAAMKKGSIPTNQDQQGVDKAPGEEQQQGEQVTREDLKGKKVDRDSNDPQDEPLK